jgi:hypothetical protein
MRRRLCDVPLNHARTSAGHRRRPFTAHRIEPDRQTCQAGHMSVQHESSAPDAAPAADSDVTAEKARFLEALERKRGRQAEGQASGMSGDSAIHHPHGRAGAKRQFRRKSGG